MRIAFAGMSGEAQRVVPSGLRDTQSIEPARSLELRASLASAPSPAPATVFSGWILQSHAGDAGVLQNHSISPLPFRIGRQSGVQMVLPSRTVSKEHAEIYRAGSMLRVRDLGSRNGTFLNRQPVSDAALHDGDILHVGDFEFRVTREGGPSAAVGDAPVTLVMRGPLPRRFADGTRELPVLLAEGAVSVVFQPILDLATGRVTAYEALGRGLYPGLPEAPLELFAIARSAGLEVELSRLFRRKALELVRSRPHPPVLFLNTHPAELEQPGIVESIEELRRMAPHVGLVLEIHESALALPGVISTLRDRLAASDVGLAYDDFGAGQARLFELAEAPPHYLKFDRRFVSGLDRAPTSRRRLVASLVAAARELLVRTVAEGVETAGEADACRRAGFTHAQGYHIGRPVPVERI